VRVVIVTGGLPVSQSMVDFATKQEVTLLLSPHDTTTTAMLCRSAITVQHMIHEHFLAFRHDEPLASIEAVAAASNFQAFPVMDDHNHTVGILSKSDFLKKVDRKLILVDHNELSQAVSGAEQVEIVEIIDHHRLGSMTTTQPILFRNEPVGSTSTIVADCFFRQQVEMTKPIAGLLLAGLVSDTLNLTSPTTTERDAQILKKLEELSGVDAAKFTEKLFSSGSVLTSLPAEEAIVADCKEFQEQHVVFSVAQIEELGFDQFWKRKDEVMSALERYRAKKNYFFSTLLVTDVVSNSSLLLVTGAKPFIKQIDYPLVEERVFELAGVVSRKKQLLPYLSHCLKKGGARAVEAA
jgi:manganese-dependent inorganic pyrophosphatase